ncbi:MAG: TonB-dependent receptor [Gammaproteobacteria bacterium]|nr:TonB-dependent receptor [Gammaproteobacteria bacterium]
MVCLLGQSQTFAQIEEVVVTAQKREQNMQDVPISIALKKGDDMRSENIGNLSEMAAQMPALNMAESGSSNLIFIRGVGSGFNPAFEQAVGIFMDGVYHGRSRLSRSAFVDVNRAEVLKGPQTSFFGNNTIAGAISVIPQKAVAGEDFNGYVTATVGEYGEVDVEAAAGGGLSDTLGARIAFRKDYDDGYVKNTFLEKRVRSEDNEFVRATLNWQPNAALDITFRGEYGDYFNDGLFAVEITDCPPGPAFAGPRASCAAAIAQGIPIDNEKNWITHQDESFGESEYQEYALNIDWEFGKGYVLTSITAFSTFDWNMIFDIDEIGGLVSPFDPTINFANVRQTEEYDQWSQEFRITSPGGETIDWLAGVYYQTDAIVYSNRQGLGFPAPFYLTPATAAEIPAGSMPGVGLFGDIDSESISAFGSATWNITERLRLAFSLRYTVVDKDFAHTNVTGVWNSQTGMNTVTPFSDAALASRLFGNPALPSIATAFGVHNELSDRSDDDLLPAVNAQWDVTDFAMLYVSYGEGFKAGGFDLNSTTGGRVLRDGYAPETVDAYEIGVKADFLDGRVRTNLAFYRSEYADLQTTTLQTLETGALDFAVGNIGELVNQGIDAEIIIAVFDGLDVRFDLSYIDSELKQFDAAPCTAAQLAVFGPGTCTQDITGGPSIFAPEISGNLRITYQRPLPVSAFGQPLQVIAMTNVFYSDEFHTQQDLDDAYKQESYWKVDARVAVGSQDGAWELAFLAKNITDEYTSSFSNDMIPGALGSYFFLPEPPRWLSFQASYKW